MNTTKSTKRQSGQIAQGKCAHELHRRKLAVKAMDFDGILNRSRMRTQLGAAQPHNQALPLLTSREPQPTRAAISKRAGRDWHASRWRHLSTRMPCESRKALLASA